MAQLVSVRLSRADASPWGFRLQGGKDFGQPLLIQKVNGGSLAEKAGLQVGDALVRVNNVDVQDMRHKDAQDTLVRAGSSFEITVQRGAGSTWKPQVSPVGQMPNPGGRSPQTVTKTSLAAKPSTTPIPSGHNVSPRPFGPSTPQMNGGDNVKAIVNKQYNSPVGMYSEDSIAETLSAQAEVLAGGVLGVNFMKNEKTYDSQKSEVFKMVQEVEKEPREPEPEFIANTPTASFPAVTGLRHVVPPEAKPPTSPQAALPPGQNICADCERLIVNRRKEASRILQIVFKSPLSNTKYFSTTSHAVGGRATSPRPLTPVARQMGTPELPQDKPYMPTESPMPGSPTCSECGKHIVGVFVRIKEKNLHVECFKCATCGTSLKNVGYYNINNKLYCDIHAKMAARQSAPAPNMEPITIPPGGRVPSAAFTSSVIPSLPTAAPKSPQPGTLAPMPFHAPRLGTRHVVAPRYVGQTSNTPGPKPFGSQVAPSPPSSVPFSVVPPSAPSATLPKPDSSRPVVWPPSNKNMTTSLVEKASGGDISKSYKKMPLNIPTLKKEDVEDSKLIQKRLSLCSEEVCTLSSKKAQSGTCTSICEIEDTNRPSSPVPDKQRGRTISKKVTANSQRSHQEQVQTTTKTKVENKLQGQVTKKSSKTTVEESHFRCGQKSVHSESSMQIRSPTRSTSSEILDISSKPHEIRSLLPPASAVRPMTPTQIVVFPPEMPPMLPRSRTATPQPKHPIIKEPENTTCKAAVEHRPITPEIKRECYTKETKASHKKETKTVHKSDTKESHKKHADKPIKEKMFTKQEVEQIIQEELKKVFMSANTNETEEQQAEVTIYDLPSPIVQSGDMASALSVAPERPFTPVPFPKPLELPSVIQQTVPPPKIIPKKPISNQPVPLPSYSKPYFPPVPPPPETENLNDRTARALREVGCRSPMTEALTVAPDRPYSPLHSIQTDEQAKSAFKPIGEPTPSGRGKKQMTMLSALTVAPNVPFTVPGKTPIPTVKIDDADKNSKNSLSAFKPLGAVSASSLIPKQTPLSNKSIPVPFIPTPIKDERSGIERTSEAGAGKTKEVVKGFHTKSAITDNSSYMSKSQFISEHTTSKTVSGQQIQAPVIKAPSGLHCPDMLPYYQQNIGEIPVRNRSISPVPHQIRAPMINPPRSPLTVQHTKQSINKDQSSLISKGHHIEKGVISDSSAYLSTTQQEQKHLTTTKAGSSGLQCPALLPYYQQNIGEIPVRNRSISPVPHLICAPKLDPPLSPVTVPKFSCSKQNVSNAQLLSSLTSQKHLSAQQSSSSHKSLTAQQSAAHYRSSTLSQTSTMSAMTSSKSVKTVTQTTTGKQYYKPEITQKDSLSPQSWKATYVRSVQNLSPITVRLPSPQPPPLKPTGELSQQTSANVIVKPKPKGMQTSAPSNSTAGPNTTQSYSKSQSSTGRTDVEGKSGCADGKSGCGEGKMGCGEGQSGCGEGKSGCGEGKSGCGEGKMGCGEGKSGCGEGKMGCGEGKSGCGEGKMGCGEGKSGCGEGKMGCGEGKSGCGEGGDTRCEKTKKCCSESRNLISQSSSSQSAYHKNVNQTSNLTYNAKTTNSQLSNYQFTPQGNIWTPSSTANTNSRMSFNVNSTNLCNNQNQYVSAFSSVSKNGYDIRSSNIPLYKTSSEAYSSSSHNQTYSSPLTNTSSTFSRPNSKPTPRLCGVNPSSSTPNAGGGMGSGIGGGIGGGVGGGKSAVAGSSAPRRGRGVLNTAVPAGGRIPLCGHCNNQIRGPFITALGKIWCPDHFTCVNAKCKRPLQDIGFVEESEGLYCEYCFEQYLAPTCNKCNAKIKGDCLNAIGKHYHPECFCCAYCDKLFGNNLFFLEDGLPYCENDWNELFTTKCIACGFPIEAGDRWVEALNNNYHSKCFNCTMCKKNLEGQSFFAKGGRPYCKTHAR